MRSQLSEQIMSASSHPLKRPQYVFRPPPVEETAADVYDRRKRGEEVDLTLQAILILPIFKRLNTTDLANCAVACKAWNKVTFH